MNGYEEKERKGKEGRKKKQKKYCKGHFPVIDAQD